MCKTVTYHGESQRSLHVVVRFKRKFSSSPVLLIRDVYLGSRILIFTLPGFRISDPTTTKEEGENFFATLFLKSQISRKKGLVEKELAEKKVPGTCKLTTKIVLFAQNIVTKFSEIWVGHPRS